MAPITHRTRREDVLESFGVHEPSRFTEVEQEPPNAHQRCVYGNTKLALIVIARTRNASSARYEHKETSCPIQPL
jgi:hypothetical protein